MTITKIFLISLVSIPSSLCFALTLSDAPIEHVTLYPSSAKVERRIPVKAGETLVQLKGLPANFDMSQLQYQTVNIDVNAVSHDDNSMERPLSQASQELKKDIKTIDDQLITQKSIKSAAELQTSFLEKLSKGSSSKVRKEALDAYVIIANADREITKLEERKVELTRDLEILRDSFYKNRDLKFNVNAPKSGQIKLSYFVNLAKWQPVYKAELDTTNNQVKLTRMAMVTQRTGEDWNNVKLTISTSTPVSHSGQLSQRTWQVNYFEPEPVIKTKSSKHSPKAAFQLMEDLNYDPFPQFTLSDDDFNVEFHTETQASILSNLQQIYLPLTTATVPAKLSIWAIPDQYPHAVINAEIPKIDQNWPSGSLKLYRDGNYVGERKWNNSTTDTLNINFGIDEQVSVKQIVDPHKKHQFNSSKLETTNNKKYIIENLHKFPIDLTVFESIPQSMNSKLTINSVFNPKPSSQGWQEQPHVNLWQLNLKPKQKFEIDIQHQFIHPTEGKTFGF